MSGHPAAGPAPPGVSSRPLAHHPLPISPTTARERVRCRPRTGAFPLPAGRSAAARTTRGRGRDGGPLSRSTSLGGCRSPCRPRSRRPPGSSPDVRARRRDPTAGSDCASAGSARPSACNARPSACSARPSACNARPSACNARSSAANDCAPAANDCAPAGNDCATALVPPRSPVSAIRVTPHRTLPICIPLLLRRWMTTPMKRFVTPLSMPSASRMPPLREAAPGADRGRGRGVDGGVGVSVVAACASDCRPARARQPRAWTVTAGASFGVSIR